MEREKRLEREREKEWEEPSLFEGRFTRLIRVKERRKKDYQREMIHQWRIKRVIVIEWMRVPHFGF